MRSDQLFEASRMWRSGKNGRTIAKTIGVKVSYLFETASKYRRLFPRRVSRPDERLPSTHRLETEVDTAADELPDDQMRWITEGGAYVTLPRISGIECPRRGT